MDPAIFDDPLVPMMKQFAKVQSIDGRGWYIGSDGIHYLYGDGWVRTGVINEDASAFWPYFQRVPFRQAVFKPPGGVRNPDIIGAVFFHEPHQIFFHLLHFFFGWLFHSLVNHGIHRAYGQERNAGSAG